MESHSVFIKNMVCRRCILTVEEILNRLQIPFEQVQLGEIQLRQPLTAKLKQELSGQLHAVGFEIIDKYAGNVIEKMKQLVIKKARNEIATSESKLKLSSYLSDQLHHEYTYLSSLFSDMEGRTIENYFIEQRIEKAKELLVYDEMTVAEIADELEFSGAAHFSTQFKKITGLTPTFFKKLGAQKRKTLDSI